MLNLQPEEILSEIYQRFTSVKPDELQRVGSFRKWLNKVIVSVIIDLYRRSKRHLAEALQSDDSVASVAKDVSDLLWYDEIEACFNQVVMKYAQSLPELWQKHAIHRWASQKRNEAGLDSFELESIGQDEPYRKIAKRFGLQPTTIYTFVSKASAEIVKQFASEYEKIDQCKFQMVQLEDEQ